MNKKALTLPAGLCLMLSIGCGSSEPGDGGAGGAGTTAGGGASTAGTPGGAGMATGGASGGSTASTCPTAMDADGNLLVMATEANDYSFSSTLSFPPILIQPDQELSFDWSAVNQDFLKHSMDPAADVDNALVMLWKLTEQELETKLNADDLKQSDLAIIATSPTEKTATSKGLFDFGTPGLMPGETPFTAEDIMPFLDINSYPPDTHTYTLMVGTGTTYSEGVRMIQAFKLDAASTNTVVAMTNDSTQLDWSVELQSLQPTPVPVGNAAITLDWSAITVNGLGGEFVRNKIGTVAIAHFQQTPAELEGTFLDLVDYDGNIQANELWLINVAAGEVAKLSDAADINGTPFAGITADGTWMLALFCFNCRNPAPWYLTFLTPCQ